jgi:hypothetical protein
MSNVCGYGQEPTLGAPKVYATQVGSQTLDYSGNWAISVKSTGDSLSVRSDGIFNRDCGF